ncbi:MAG: hypothetical protein AB8H80_01090 [Planctomycetota bacterium]
MNQVAKQRVAIVAVALLLLALRGLTVAHISAAVVAALFFCWLVGPAKNEDRRGVRGTDR